MNLPTPNLPKIDMNCLKNKVKRIWDALNEDNLEIKINTSVMGLILFSCTVAAVIGTYKHAAKAETQKALREQRKQLEREKLLAIEAVKAER